MFIIEEPLSIWVMGRENRPWPRGLRAEVGSESMEKLN